jgi:hypothetical protein
MADRWSGLRGAGRGARDLIVLAPNQPPISLRSLSQSPNSRCRTRRRRTIALIGPTSPGSRASLATRPSCTLAHPHDCSCTGAVAVVVPSWWPRLSGWDSLVIGDEVTAPSRMEQSARVGGGCSQVVRSSTEPATGPCVSRSWWSGSRSSGPGRAGDCALAAIRGVASTATPLNSRTGRMHSVCLTGGARPSSAACLLVARSGSGSPPMRHPLRHG